MTPAQLDDTEDRLPKSLREKLRAREEAMVNHVQLKTSRKIRQAILAKVRPTRGRKGIGRWYFLKRANEKDWWGPGQLIESLVSHATLRMGKHFYSARNDNLVELTRNKLVEQVGENHEEINEQGMVDKCQQTEEILQDNKDNNNPVEREELVSEVEYFKQQEVPSISVPANKTNAATTTSVAENLSDNYPSRSNSPVPDHLTGGEGMVMADKDAENVHEDDGPEREQRIGNPADS